MEIKYDVDIPNVRRRAKSEEHLSIIDFLESDYKTMSFTYGNKDECYQKYNSLRGTVYRKKYNVRVMVRGNTIYVAKGERK